MEGLVSADKTVLPLKNVAVQVKVKGCLIGISSTLSYSNDTSNPLEVSFRFPLEESFAVVGLEAIIDGRKVKGDVKEKQKAKDMYEDAISSGLSAAYAEEKSGDIFSLSLGNLPSGSEAQISIKMVGELPIEADGRVRFTLPSVLKPRYTPEGSIDPLAAAQHPSVKQASVPGVFEFKMRVEGSAKVEKVSSPTHKLKIDQTSDCAVNVCIAEEGPVRGDVTILIGYKDPHEPTAIVEPAVEGSKTKEMKSKAVMLNFFPKFASIEAACEFIFVVDRSGSMRGPYIKSASETLVLFLKSIPEGCYFNIVSFGSRYESFFPSSQPYNQETMEKATKFAENMQADFGGTELLAPLQFIFKQKPQSSGLPRQVFILTDGSVSNTDRVISEVRKNSHSTRCFTFGIGSGASTALVRGIARAGNGSAEFIADNERMQSKVIRSLKKALQPSANNVAVNFDLPSNYQVKVVPEIIPGIYNGEKTVIYGLLMEKSEQKGKSMKCKATLTGDIIGKKFKFDIPFELTDEPSEEDVSVIHQLAVKKMIQEWQDDEEPFEQRHKKEIIELSTDANVVSRYTAYIAVDVAQNKPVTGSMQSYELFAEEKMIRSRGRRAVSAGFGPKLMMSSGAPMRAAPMMMSPPRGMSLSMGLDESAPVMKCKKKSASAKKFKVVDGIERSSQSDRLLDVSDMKCDSMMLNTTTSSVKQTGVNFIVSLQQANGSWLLNDQLAGEVVSKSVEELKRCCPVSCDDTVMANIWATLVVIELLKKKYPSMLEELELVIMKAEQWLSKQALPSGVNLAVLKENATKLL